MLHSPKAQPRVSARTLLPLPAARAAAIVVALTALALKLTLAAHSIGSVDVQYFHKFSNAILRVGPVRIYGTPLPELPVYNHPPLTSWTLLLLGHIARHGVPFSTLIRIPPCLGDFASGVVVFEIMRRRQSPLVALGCSAAVSASPVLVTISAYHGNTDGLCVMWALASAYLLADLRSPLAAGIAAGLAIGVKLPPVVALPLLLVGALRMGRPTAARFLLGLGATTAVLWGPAALTEPSGLLHKVLEYQGGGGRQWGLLQVGAWLDLPRPLLDYLHGSGHFLLVLLCMAFGVLLARRAPESLPAVCGLTLAALLFLSTGTGVQYLAWAAPALLAVGLWPGLWYNTLGGALAVMLFTRWSGGFPWYHARASRWTDAEVFLGVLCWTVLGIAIAYGAWTVWTGTVPMKATDKSVDDESILSPAEESPVTSGLAAR